MNSSVILFQWWWWLKWRYACSLGPSSKGTRLTTPRTTFPTQPYRIGHFRVPKTLAFKMRPSSQPFLWKCVLFAREWKITSISKVDHLTLWWYRGSGEHGNGPLLWEGVAQRGRALSSLSKKTRKSNCFGRYHYEDSTFSPLNYLTSLNVDSARVWTHGLPHRLPEWIARARGQSQPRFQGSLLVSRRVGKRIWGQGWVNLSPEPYYYPNLAG